MSQPKKPDVTVRVPAGIETEVRSLPVSDRKRVLRALRRLASDPLAGKPLQGPLRAYRSIRAGRDFRVVYRFDATTRTVDVLRVADRKDVYR